ncbi:hypothetical protein [Cytobacillus purgationiresistens]|uniref:Uncharacterized protein n=1 Tax=Cytobacillus purgationiresistens TaxID=863449 RepID=A0ABU0AIZ3_9BACI|nr:hypothetical protein [Cytobacillus purgationiresistens]MDQ0271228.1 hypothetical protein [Cytobacillus purgationiresistens]
MLGNRKIRDITPVTKTNLSIEQKKIIVTKIDKLLKKISIQENEVINDLYYLKRKFVSDSLEENDLEKLNKILLLKPRLRFNCF